MCDLEETTIKGNVAPCSANFVQALELPLFIAKCLSRQRKNACEPFLASFKTSAFNIGVHVTLAESKQFYFPIHPTTIKKVSCPSFTFTFIGFRL